MAKREKLKKFYGSICMNFVSSLRALSLYELDHPETKKRLDNLYGQLGRYLEHLPAFHLLFLEGDVVAENIPLPELSKNLEQFIKILEPLKIQRIIFRRGLSAKELTFFLELLRFLVKNPSSAEQVISKNQEKMPHILAGTLGHEAGFETSYEVLSSAIHAARQAVISLSGQLKDLFKDIDGPLSKPKVDLAKATAKSIHLMNTRGEVPLKVLIYRGNSDPDPCTHAINVSALSMALAKELDFEESVVEDIGIGALLHDIGLHVPIRAPSSEAAAVSFDEKKRQWEHPVRGAEMLVASPGLPDLAPVVAYEHHIGYDGEGYPDQKFRRELNPASMITFVTNSYDNLRRNRPEQKALSLKDALNRMDQGLGTHYHPIIYKNFRRLTKAQAQDDVAGRAEQPQDKAPPT